MVKKLKATNQLFSVAAKQLRAAQRDARETEMAQRETMLNESILPSDILEPNHTRSSMRMEFARLDGELIATISHWDGSTIVGVKFNDGAGTFVDIQHAEECKSLLTFRKVWAAIRFPNGAANLAALVRHRDAEAEAEQIQSATSIATVANNQNRL